jgi:hypothetical protein
MSLTCSKLKEKMTEMNEHQAVTRNIRKPGEVGNSNFCTFTQTRNGLIGWSFEIPAYAYCQPLWVMQEKPRTE